MVRGTAGGWCIVSAATPQEDSWGVVPVDSRIHMATEGVDLDAMFAAIAATETVGGDQ